MKSIYVFCFVALLAGLMSCKQDGATQTAEPAQGQTTENAQNANPTGGSQQPQATASSTTGGHDYTFLTDKLFHYQAAFGGKSTDQGQPYKDEWIDLAPDGTFKAGKLKEQTHTGQWSYNHDNKTLFLRPDSNKFKMSEWKVMFNEQMMVWVGTQTYGNNDTQIKLVRKDGLPE
jgi:hypothetical protein